MSFTLESNELSIKLHYFCTVCSKDLAEAEIIRVPYRFKLLYMDSPSIRALVGGLGTNKNDMGTTEVCSEACKEIILIRNG